MMKTIPDDSIRDLAENWERYDSQWRSKIVQETAQRHDVSKSTVYRQINEYRKTGRVAPRSRSDKGKIRIYPEDQMRVWIGSIMGYKTYNPHRPDKKAGNPNKVPSTARSIQVLENLELIPEGLNPRTVNRIAKAWELRPQDICAPTPSIHQVSLHPNHVFMVDFSVSQQFYLREKDGKLMTKGMVYKNRPNEACQKLWLFSLVDHYTNAKFFKYFISAGESTEIFVAGLIEAMSVKRLPDGSIDYRFPFHGVPKIIISDRGSALMSEKSQNFLKALGVESLTHMPGNPRAKGAVESSFRHFQNDFEHELLYNPASSLDELQERTYNWNIEHNWKVKTGEKRSRNSIWQGITTEQLMVPPPIEILWKCVSSYETRTVDAYCDISLHNEKFGVPPELCGKKVRVWNNIDGGILAQNIETGDMHEICEQRTAVFGEYNAFPKTEQQRSQETAIKQAAEIRKIMTPDVLRREVPNLHALPKEGTPIEVDSDLVQVEAESYESIYKAKCAIADELRINLGNLPGWMIDDIEGALKMTLNKERVYKIARFVAGFLEEMRDVG